MRGRDTFYRLEGILNFLTSFFRLLPRGLARELWHAADHLPGLLGVGFRYSLARALTASMGKSVYWGPRVTVRGWERLSIGDNVSIHQDCYIDASGEVFIGSDVSVAHATSILSANHTWSDPGEPIRSNPLSLAPVRISDDVWVGCGVRILAGAVVETRSVVAAGSVVTRVFPPHTLIGGVPARKIKDI